MRSPADFKASQVRPPLAGDHVVSVLFVPRGPTCASTPERRSAALLLAARSPASTRLGVSGNVSNHTPVASYTAAVSAGAYVMNGISATRAPNGPSGSARLEDLAVDLHRNVADAGNQIPRGRGFVMKAVGELEVLAHRVAVRLNDSPPRSGRWRGVDRLADVVGRRDPVDTDVAGIDIDGDLDALRHVAVAEVRRTGAGLGIERLGGWRRVPEEATSWPIALAPGLLGLLGGTEDRMPAMNVGRLADAEPGSPEVAVSEKCPWMSSSATPVASDAI